MKIKSTNDKSYNKCQRRIVIWRDENVEWIRDWCDHTFVLWSNVNHLRGDRNAESPFIEDDDGNYKLRDGVIAYPISIYEHSGISYHLGEYDGVDARWDATQNAMYLWTDKEHYGEGWEKVTDEELYNIAKEEVHELNLDALGDWYGYCVEERKEFTKVYKNGIEENGYEYDCVDSCGGYLTDDPREIDFGCDNDTETEIFADENCSWMIGKEI